MKRSPLLLVTALCWLATSTAPAADPRADFLKLIDRPRVPLAPQVEELPGTNGFAQFHFSFAADAEQRVPGLLLKTNRSNSRQPVVIALHGTGGSKNSMLSVCRKLADKGFIAVAIDGRYHGERTKNGKGAVEYEEAIVRAWREPREHPFYYDTVRDVMRLVDYLQTRDDVDAKRIGLIGISKGGIETYLAAAVDERIAVAVPCIGVQSFHWAVTNNAWQGRIGTIQHAFDTAAKEAGVDDTRRGVREKVLRSRRSRHRWRVRWSDDAAVDRAASVAGDQRRFGQSHAVGRRAGMRRGRAKGLPGRESGGPFCRSHSGKNRPSGAAGIGTGGDRLVREVAEALI